MGRGREHIMYKRAVCLYTQWKYNVFGSTKCQEKKQLTQAEVMIRFKSYFKKQQQQKPHTIVVQHCHSILKRLQNAQNSPGQGLDHLLFSDVLWAKD